jgi:hypothetical protein
MIPLTVLNRMIEVEVASGVVAEDHFLIYLTLREKHAHVEVVCSNPAIVSLRATVLTRRYSKLDFDTLEVINFDGPSTLVTLPVGWTVEASVSGYTCVLVGVRTPVPEKLVDVPINFAISEDAAVQAACRPA